MTSIYFKSIRTSVVSQLTLTVIRTVQSDVRVRFAPSPTGNIHLGGLRTALYNFLFARVNHGKFILRIEDTDQSRVIPGAAEKIEEDLVWAGLQPDESPSLGGPLGPYVQSHRLHLYRKYADDLLKMSKAYPCFCSEKRLSLLRKEAIRLQAIPKYDNYCRSLDQTEVASKINNGDPYCIRFKLDPEPETFDDLVFGKVNLNSALIEGDPVILKRDGFPTYHLACVVDDHCMKISHVLRGVEWQVSTSKHLQIHRAFGWMAPKFGHLPLLLNTEGVKLSKRHGDIEIDNFRKSGVFPDVLLSFVTEFGGGFKRSVECGSKHFTYSILELVKQFDFSSLNTSSCRVDLTRLERLNRSKLKASTENPDSLLQISENLRGMIIEHFKDELPSDSDQLSDERLAVILQWGLPRMHRLSGFLGPDLKFLWVRPSLLSLSSFDFGSSKPYTDIMQWVSSSLQQDIPNWRCSNYDHVNKSLISQLNEHCLAMNTDFKTVTKLLRAVLSGLKAGPPIMELIYIIGPDEAIKRLEKGIEALQSTCVSSKSNREES